MKIRLLSYNIHKGFDTFGTAFVLHEIREALRETQADILFLQEVVGENKKHAKNISQWPKETQFEFLADQFWPHHAYGKNAVFDYRNHGNAILSRFSISATHNLNISNHRWEQRGLLHLQVQIPELQNRSLHLLNTHIDLLEMHRRRQAHKIADYISQKIPQNEALIFCGDFNDWQGNIHRLLSERLQLQECFHTLHGRTPKTFPSFFPLLSLDRVLVRGLQPRLAKIQNHAPWSRLSDHLPLLVEIDLD